MFLKNAFVLLLAMAALASLATSVNGMDGLGPAQLSSTSGTSCTIYNTQTIPYVSTVYINVVSGATYTVTQVQYGSTWTNMFCFTVTQPTTMVNSQPGIPISFAVLSSAIAFPVLVVGILMVGVYRKPAGYHPTKTASSWFSVAGLTGGGMLLVASLWQLEIVDISRSVGDCAYIWPFDLGGPTCWWIARDFWFAGVFAAFVLALIGAVTYARFTTSGRTLSASRSQGAPALCVSLPHERLYQRTR